MRTEEFYLQGELTYNSSILRIKQVIIIVLFSLTCIPKFLCIIALGFVLPVEA